MLKTIFTLDYEIHGNGDGSPRALMVEPTARLLRLFENYGARLTIMADVAEILKFREYAKVHGMDDYSYVRIVDQLREAVRCGHDVQMHIHSSYFNARHEQGCWKQDWSEYDFAGLRRERMREVVRLGKDFLESLLRPVREDYRCFVFRAANWSVSPSKNVVRALVENGIKIDTSVFKHGRREGLVNFDYAGACSEMIPWAADENDICASSENGKLMEFPIYSESRWLGAFVTPQRIYRALIGRLHKLSGHIGASPAAPAGAGKSRRNGMGKLDWLARRHAWKADFNQCSGRQLIRALERAEARYGSESADLPFVLIGHSKLFTRFNEWSLRPFLSFVASQPQRFGFGTFSDFGASDRNGSGKNPRLAGFRAVGKSCMANPQLIER